jgi:sugar lactone lactonase YvrE
MYHTDTMLRTVYTFQLKEDGQLGPRRRFLTFKEEWGYPDGMTTDEEGGIWIAHWGGARISRFNPDGSLDRSIPIPASSVTSIVFAGPGLDRMFVTTAARGCSGEPLAGSLFEVSSGAVGCASRRFAG